MNRIRQLLATPDLVVSRFDHPPDITHRLSFPRTEIQLYGDVAILYSLYSFEVQEGDDRAVQSGRATEIFVRRNGRWENSGWHLDSGK